MALALSVHYPALSLSFTRSRLLQCADSRFLGRYVADVPTSRVHRYRRTFRGTSNLLFQSDFFSLRSISQF